MSSLKHNTAVGVGRAASTVSKTRRAPPIASGAYTKSDAENG